MKHTHTHLGTLTLTLGTHSWIPLKTILVKKHWQFGIPSQNMDALLMKILMWTSNYNLEKISLAACLSIVSCVPTYFSMKTTCISTYTSVVKYKPSLLCYLYNILLIVVMSWLDAAVVASINVLCSMRNQCYGNDMG